MAKQVDVKALREQAKTKRTEIATHRGNLTVANKELRAVQKIVAFHQKLMNKATNDLDKIKAKIATATAK